MIKWVRSIEGCGGEKGCSSARKSVSNGSCVFGQGRGLCPSLATPLPHYGMVDPGSYDYCCWWRDKMMCGTEEWQEPWLTDTYSTERGPDWVESPTEESILALYRHMAHLRLSERRNSFQKFEPLKTYSFEELKKLCKAGMMRTDNGQMKLKNEMGLDDIDSLSITDSGVFSDNDALSSGRSSPISCKEGLQGDRERFAILTYDQVKRVDGVLNENVALEGRGNFPSLELKLKDLLTAVKERLNKEGLKIRDIRLNGGAASYSLMSEKTHYCFTCGYNNQPCGDDPRYACYCAAEEGISTDGSGPKASAYYNDIDLIFGMELSTAKHFDRVKTAVLDAILDLLPPQVSRKRMSPCALKEAYVSKMVKVCDGDRWSLIALGNGQPNCNGNRVRSCTVELKFVDIMRRQYEFSVDSFQIILDSLMLFYKCANVPMSEKFYPTVVGESVYGDFNEALHHLHQGLIATRHPEEIRGGGLLKYCNLLVRGYGPADSNSLQPLQRYMCSRFFIDFPEVDQQESKLRTYLANHMSTTSSRYRYEFLLTLYHVVNSSTVCLMGHERRLTLQLIQRLACQLFATDYCGQGIYGAAPSQLYCYSTYYMPQCTLTTTSTVAGVTAVSGSSNEAPQVTPITCSLDSMTGAPYFTPALHTHSSSSNSSSSSSSKGYQRLSSNSNSSSSSNSKPSRHSSSNNNSNSSVNNTSHSQSSTSCASSSTNPSAVSATS